MKAFCSPYTTGLYKRDMKAEVTVASLRSVGTGWHSGRAVTHHWNSHAGAFLSDRVQSGFCNWRPFTREGFCLRADANGSFCSTQTGCSGFHLPGVARVISMGTVYLAVCVYVFVTINHLPVTSVSLLTMMTSRIFWKSFLKPSVALQNRAKFPSRSCRMRERSLSVLLEHTNTHTCTWGQENSGWEHKHARD